MLNDLPSNPGDYVGHLLYLKQRRRREILRRVPRTPRDVRQTQAIRSLIRAGGVERKAKGGHRMVKMPNGNTIPVPTGLVKPGTLEAIVRGAGLTMDEFVALL